VIVYYLTESTDNNKKISSPTKTIVQLYCSFFIRFIALAAKYICCCSLMVLLLLWTYFISIVSTFKI